MNKVKIAIVNTYFRITKHVNENFTTATFLVFGFFLVSFLLMYMNLPVVSSNDDHYFHFRFAEKLLQNGFLNSFRDFKTIYFTSVAHGEHLLYYNFLFYIVLLPFTAITPLFLAIKLFAIMSVALIGTLLYIFFKKLDIRYSFIWAVGFFSILGLGTFWRLFLSRPFVLSPFITLLLILALHKRKYFWIFILSLIPLFWHTATFFVPILVGIVYFVCYAFYYKKYLWKELAIVAAGFLAAIVIVTFIDHGFFISIRDNLFKVLSGVVNFSSDKVTISEGSEVYPRNIFDLINQNLFLCSLFIFSVMYYILGYFNDLRKTELFDTRTKDRKVIALAFFLLATVFIIAIPNISFRFSDFFIFFGWIFIVLTLDELFSQIEFTKTHIKKFARYSLFVCLLYLFLNSTLQLNDIFASSGNSPEVFSEVGHYLSQNLKKGDVVFNINWSWFPRLYYYAPDQNYVIGLEPKLVYLYNPEMYWMWASIPNGYICREESCPDLDKENDRKIKSKKEYLPWIKDRGTDIANVVSNDFKSNYIMSSSDYPRLNFVLNNSKRFEKVLSSRNEYFIYKVLPQ